MLLSDSKETLKLKLLPESSKSSKPLGEIRRFVSFIALYILLQVI